MNIGLVFTSVDSSSPQSDLIETSSAVCTESLDELHSAIESEGDKVYRIETNDLLSGSSTLSNVDVVLNLSRGIGGPNSESLVPAILDSLGVPYTGSDTLSTSMCQDKFSCNSALRGLRLPAPTAAYFDSIEAIDDESSFVFPSIIKPNSRRSAVGISESSIVESKEEILSIAEVLFEKKLGPLVLEEFVEGRELIIPILASPMGKRILDLPILEVKLGEYRVYGSEFRSNVNNLEIFKAPFNIKALKDNLIHLAHAACIGMGIREWGRVEIKLKPDNTPSIIEVESIPDIVSITPWTTLSAKISGVEVIDLVNLLLERVIKINSRSNSKG